MQIAILGMGNVGAALAKRWNAAGHGIGTPKRKSSNTAEHPGVTFGETQEIIAPASVVVICLPWEAVAPALSSAGNLDGKILIDCTNPVTPQLDGLLFGVNTSAAEQIQAAHPKSPVVKAFNTLGASLLGNANFQGKPADGFHCSDSHEAKQTIQPLITAAGLHPVDVGPLRNARYLEAMAMLWIDLAVRQKRGPSFVFNLVSKS